MNPEIFSLTEENDKILQNLLVSLRNQLLLYKKACRLPEEAIDLTEDTENVSEEMKKFIFESKNFVDLIVKLKTNTIRILNEFPVCEQRTLNNHERDDWE